MDLFRYILSLIVMPLIFFFALTLNITRKKIKKKSLEFRVILYVTVTSCILVEIVITATYYYDNLIITSIIYMVGFVLLNRGLDYTVDNIQDQEEIINTKNNELVNVIKSSSDISVNVANSVTELAASASEVNATAEEIAATTMNVTQGVQQQARSLQEINSMAQDIKGVIKIVTSISDQTNLLALNASIEAGRAGEAGLGFAVVAEKVQKLAEESKNSVEKTIDIVTTIIKKIEEVTSYSQEISHSMEEISSAAEEQTASMEEIASTSSFIGGTVQSLKEQLSKSKN